MTELIVAGIIFVFLFFIMFCLGNFVRLFEKKEKYSIGCRIVSGFVFYFFLFEIIAFPVMIARQPLHRLTMIWGSVIAFLVLAACVKFGKSWWEEWKARKLRGYSAGFYLMLFLIGLQCVFAALWTDNSPDAAYYVANVSANVATDTINIYEPFTGAMQETFYTRYLFGLYPVHNSVVCQLTGVHPLVLTKTLMSVAAIVLSYTVWAQVGKKLFDKREQVWMLLSFLSVIQFFFHTIYSNASFLLTRGYEGKALLANVILPFILYLGLCLFENIKNRSAWLLLFATTVAGVDISMSAMSIVPVAASAACLVAIIGKRSWKSLIYYGICMVPSVLILAVYLLTSKGYLTFHI